MHLLWTDEAWEDYLYWQGQNSKTEARQPACPGYLTVAYDGIANQRRKRLRPGDV